MRIGQDQGHRKLLDIGRNRLEIRPDTIRARHFRSKTEVVAARDSAGRRMDVMVIDQAPIVEEEVDLAGVYLAQVVQCNRLSGRYTR